MTAVETRPEIVPPSRVPPPVDTPDPARTWSALAIVVLIANGLVLADAQIPVLRPAAGLLLLIGLPTYLVLTSKSWGPTEPAERLVYSLLLVLLGVLVLGLAANELLPLVGVNRPLDPVPVLLVTDAALAGLLGWARPRRILPARPARQLVAALAGVADHEWVVVATGMLSTLLAVVGAIRLNNGAGGGVSVAMLCVAAGTFVMMFRWRAGLRRPVMLGVLYLLALSLLLMTSLRGWGVIGHDVVREFHIFQLAEANGNWDMDRFRDPYNACLSLSVLPMMLAGLTGLSGVIVFKVLLQAFFALCPVIVYLIASQFRSRLIALLSVLYFIGFPTFFGDMPFLVRQEIAFLFLGGAFLVVTNRRWSVARRRRWVVLFAAGIVLSHYSTTYIFVAVLALTVLCRWILTAGFALRARLQPGRGGLVWPQPPVIGVLMVGVVAAMALAWTGPITGTGGQVERTLGDIVSALTGTEPGDRAAETSYSLFPAPRPAPATLLAEYDAQARAESAPYRAVGELYPVDTLDRYPLSVTSPLSQPLTALGRELLGAGLDPATLNTVMRQGLARLLQLFVCVGLLVVALGRTHGIPITREAYLMAVAGFLVVLSQLVLPAVSVDYGLLRAFQQALFVVAPFLAAGSAALLGWLRVRIRWTVAITVALTCFLSLTGVIPVATGGYGAQLGLANAGSYYDDYYRHPQEVAAVDWLQERAVASGAADIQTAVPTDTYTYGLVDPHPEITVQDGVYPSLLRRGSYVLLGTTIVATHRDTVTYGGDELIYRYPIGLLDRNKDRIYSSNGAEVYR